MLHVAVLCEFPTLLGGERSMLAAAEILAAGKVRFTAVAPQGPCADAWKSFGADVVPWAHHAGNAASATQQRDHNRSLPARRDELHAILSRIRPRVVHANSLSTGRLAGPVANALGVPGIAHLRDITKLNRAWIADLATHRRLLAVSESARIWHLNQGLPADRLHTLYNGVDLAVFRPRPPTGFLHAELGVALDTPFVLGVGQIILRKGWDAWLAVADSVIARHPTACFVLIGACYSPKAETRSLEARIRGAAEGRLRGRLFWLGQRADVARILPEVAILLHTARQEPLGRVLLEAAASGRPVVATSVGGTPEIFGAAGTAVLVDVDDASTATDTVLELLADAARRNTLGEAARRRAVENFDVRSSATALLDHYEQVAATV